MTDPDPTDDGLDPNSLLSPKDEATLQKIANPAIRAGLRSLKRAMDARAAQARAAGDAQQITEQEKENPKDAPSKVVALTPWADDKRAAPNAVFRSALFPALNNKGGRKFLKEQKLYSVGGLEVKFTGEQFDQSDLDVYLEILNFAKGMPLGQPVTFSAYAMLKALGRCTGKSDHEWLHSVLVRLRGGTVEVLTGQAHYFGGLIEGGFKDKMSKHYEVMLNPNYAVLFGFGLWSAIDIEQRRALKQNSTAKALHAYYSTHAAPGLHRYETLAAIVGLEGKNRRDVKASLIRAHEGLKEMGFLLEYEATPIGIEVKSTMTPGQQQHALKKIIQKVARKKPPKDTG